MHTPAISVIVLSWNGRDLLQPCLDSLYAQSISDYEVVVVDNGSHDGSATLVRQRYPQARLLPLARNRGFSGGVNAGLSAARGDYIVLFNNDAVAEPTYLEQLTAPLQHDPNLGAAAGVLVFAHQPQIIASAGIVFHANGVALDAHMLQPIDGLPRQPEPVWGASGGAVAYRRSALADVGIFDEGYFAYLEDVDLAWRLRGRGWQTQLAPQAQARHIYSATGGEGSPLKRWLLARNRWRVLLRCVPAPILAQLWPQIIAYDLLACAQALLSSQLTTITGRLASLQQLRALRHQRRQIQARYTATSAELARWIAPALSPLNTYRQIKALQQVLAQRSQG